MRKPFPKGCGFLKPIPGICLFVLVIFLFACIRVKLEGNDLPKAFKGVPIALIVAGIMAIVFMGLGGMVDLGSWGIA